MTTGLVNTLTFFKLPKGRFILFLVVSLVYLISCGIPREWHRTFFTLDSFAEQQREQHANKPQRCQIRGNEALTVICQNYPSGKPSQASFFLRNDFSPFDSFTLEAQIQGNGKLTVWFNQKTFYETLINAPTPQTVLLQGNVVPGQLPRLIFTAETPATLEKIAISEMKLFVTGYRSYGSKTLPLLILAFLWILLLPVIPKKIDYGLLAIILVLGAIFRLAYNLEIQELPFSDMADYEQIALGLLSGNETGHHPFFQSFYAHGLPYYVVAIYFLFGIKNMLALRLVNLGLAVLTNFLIYRCGCKIAGNKAGLISAALFAFSQEMVFWGAKLSTEHLFACMTIVSLFCVLTAWRTAHWSWFLAAGIALGYLFFIRSVLHFFLLPLAIGFLLFHSAAWQKRIGLGIIFISGFLIVLSPWIYRGYARHNTLMLTGTGGWFSFMHQNNDGVLPGRFGGREYQDYYHTEGAKRFENDVLAAKWTQQEAINWVKNNPMRYIQLSFGRFYMLFGNSSIALTRVHPKDLNFWSTTHFYLFKWDESKYGFVGWLTGISLLLLIGQLFFQWRHQSIGFLFFNNIPILFFSGISFLYLATLSFPRYREPLLPLAYVIIGIAMVAVVSWFQTKGSPRLLKRFHALSPLSKN